MASIASDKGGFKRILFKFAEDDRRAVRLGKAHISTAQTVKVHVEALNIARMLNTPIPAPTAEWVSKISPDLHKRLARVGLVEPREAAQTVTLGGMLDGFFLAYDGKPATIVRMKQVRNLLEGHFTREIDVATIGEAEAEAWRAKLKEQKYATATIARSVTYSRQYWKWAVKRGMAPINPFLDVKTGSLTNSDRQEFIDRDTIAKVIDAAPDAEWRLLIALSRFGGLRVPSEALALRWNDVDWANNRMTVRSCKTEHHEGKGERMIPIFPEVLPHLQAVYDAAPEGSVNVIGRYREGANLNPHFRRIIKRAGLTPWARTWHNLRASRQTELASTFPLHTVCAWIGNTKAIAAGHYLQVTDADFTRAVGDEAGMVVSTGKRANYGARGAQIAAQQANEPKRGEAQQSTEVPVFAGVLRHQALVCASPHKDLMGRAGLEPATPAFSMRCSTN